MPDLDPYAKLDRMNADIASPGSAAGDAVLDPRALEVARLAGLASLDYQAERTGAAGMLGIGVTALDKAVRSEQARRRDAEAYAHRIQPPPAPGEVRWPPDWAMEPGGLYGPPGRNAPPVWLSAPFEVLGETRDHAGEEWGLWLRWRDGDGTLHTYAMPHALVMMEPGRLEAELVRRGLRISADPGARLLLRRALSDVRSGSRVRIAYATGWQGDNAAPAFLLPNGEMLGSTAEPVVLHNPAADAAQRCSVVGTLDGWKDEVAALALGNPLPVFCISGGFAGPILQIAGDAGGGIHLAGGSKRGKTLALQMALSAWSLPYKAGGALRDWRSTANALEATAEECTDGLLALDELHQANPTEVAAACYMLADGAGKGRLRRDASAARRRTWRAFIISTGEPDLPAAVARAGQKLPAGAEVRLPSIPVEGIREAWADLHGRADLPTLAADIHKAMRRHHGTAARAFVGRLAETLADDSAGLVNFLEAMRDRFTARLPTDADPQVRDVARRAALMATAGELAACWGIVPWNAGEAERASVAMLGAWIARRSGGSGAAEPAAHLERVREALVQHGAGRFTLLVAYDGIWHEDHPDRPVHNRIGWRKRLGERDEFLIPPETWRTEICAQAGLDPTATARTLAGEGFIRRGDGKNLQVRERLPGFSNPVRLYAVSAALLETRGESDGEPSMTPTFRPAPTLAAPVGAAASHGITGCSDRSDGSDRECGEETTERNSGFLAWLRALPPLEPLLAMPAKADEQTAMDGDARGELGVPDGKAKHQAEAEVLARLDLERLSLPDTPPWQSPYVPDLVSVDGWISSLRPSFWPDIAEIPLNGNCCNGCYGRRWWREATAPSGWRCHACHPPTNLGADAIKEKLT